MHEAGGRKKHQRISGPDYGLPSQHRGRGFSLALTPRVDILPEGYGFGRGYATDPAMHPIARVQAPGTGDKEMEMGDDEDREEDCGEDRRCIRSKI